MAVRAHIATVAVAALLAGSVSATGYAAEPAKGGAQSGDAKGGGADPKAAGAAHTGAAYPKGHYSNLNSLPDWGGVWVFSRPLNGGPPDRPALKGQYLKDFQAWQEAVKAKGGEVPREGSYCTPPGMPGIMSIGQYPMEFLFTPGRVTTHHEAWMQWRNIFTDGRPHPPADELEGSFEGDSTGHWEGSTLAVDTIGIKPAVALGQGMKHSAQLHITERIHLDPKDPDVLIDEMTLEDPLALEKPWVRSLPYKRSRDWQLLEFECAENDRNPVDSAGKTGFTHE